MQYKSIEFIPKIEVDSLETLALVYTPGVGYACQEIEKDKEKSYDYTNRTNSVAVISFDYDKSLKRAIFLKSTLNIDAYPLEVEITPHPTLSPKGRGNATEAQSLLQLVVENIEPNFCGFDMTLISEEIKGIDFNVQIPILKEKNINIMDFFQPLSRNIFQFDINKLEGDFKQKSLYLRERAGGVIESRLSEDANQKPVVTLSDGSSVLGFGNIGAEAGIPVMEGKTVLFRALGGVNAISLCVKTQEVEEIIKIAHALKNSFSGINLEDISAPRCFEIEERLIDELDIPVSHDDQHGTAIVVLAALLNALSVAEKELSEVKIVISGAGAAAQAVSKLLLSAGALNIVHSDKDGVVYKNRPENDKYLEELTEITNKDGSKGELEDIIEGADVFIGLSAAGVLKPEFVKKMADKPIVFALANPTPEIMPDVAKAAGAFIVATGRSDFDNQINNSLVFPGLFQGVLTHKIKKITEEIQIECAFAVASLIKDKDLSVTNILPNALDPMVPAIIVNRLASFK